MSLEPRTWIPTVPPAATAPATLVTGQAAPRSSAAGVPDLFEGLLAGLAELESQIDQLPPASRVGTVAIERLADDGRLTLDLRGLPAEQVDTVPFKCEAGSRLAPGSGLRPFSWAASEGDLILRVMPEAPINQLNLGAFGEGQLRVLRDDYDSGWLDCAWERLIPVPFSDAPFTLQMTSTQQWAGLSRLSCEAAVYVRDALLTLGTLATGTRVEVEAGHSGTVVVEYADGPDGTFVDRALTSTNESLVTLSIVNSNLEIPSLAVLPAGSTLWAGLDGWRLESYVGKLLMDDQSGLIDEAGGPELWDSLDERLISQGIISLGAGAQSLSRGAVPSDYTWRLRCQLYCLKESSGDYTVSGVGDGRISLWVNGSRVSISSEGTYTLRLKAGLNEVAYFGRAVTSGAFTISLGISAASSFRDTHYIHDWFAVTVPIGDQWPLTAWAQDAGLSSVFACQRSTRLKTSLFSGDTVCPYSGGTSSAGALTVLQNDVSVAQNAKIRFPQVPRRYVRARLSGGPLQTPVLRVVRT